MTYVFLGTYTEIYGHARLTDFGQRVDLPEEIAKDAIAGDCAMIPAEEFDAIGFTPDELRKFAKASSHGNAPAEFLEKKKQALVKFHELRGE